MYSLTRNNPLTYIDPDGRELRFAAGQSAADQQALTSSLAHSYQKQSFRQKFDQLAKSKHTFYVEKTNIPQPPQDPNSVINKSVPGQNDVRPIDKSQPISPSNFTDTIQLDNNKFFGEGRTPEFQDSVTGHEFFHGVNVDNDVVGMQNKKNDQAASDQEENNADAFGDQVANETNSMSLQDATAAVQKALGLGQPSQNQEQQKEQKAEEQKKPK